MKYFIRQRIWDPKAPSRETTANIISTFTWGGEFIDVMNVPNVGQISNLPQGCVVETLGVINSLGFTPLAIGELPKTDTRACAAACYESRTYS